MLVIAVIFPIFDATNVAYISLVTEVFVYGLVVLSLNLLIGFGGQVSIGQAGMLAVGAYTAAIIATRFSVPEPIDLLAAGVAAGIVGLLLGMPARRLRGHYLAIVTLGFGVAVPQVALNMTNLTGGSSGIALPSATLGPFSLATPVSVYYYVLAVVCIIVLAVAGLVRTKSGRAFMAVRDSEQAATAMGVAVGRTKVVVFVLSSFICGLAGDLFARNNGFVGPSSFSFSLSLLFLVAVIVGGLGSIWGSLIGALVVVVVQNETTAFGGLADVLLGGAVVVALVLAPGGLASLPRQVGQARWWRWGARRTGLDRFGTGRSSREPGAAIAQVASNRHGIGAPGPGEPEV